MLRQLALNNLVLLAQYGVAGLVPLVLVPHLVHTLGLAAFGALAVALAWANYGAVVVQYAFPLNGPRQLAHLESGDTVLDVVCRIASAKLALFAGVAAAGLAGLGAAAALGHPASAPQAAVLLALPLAATMHAGWHLQTAGRFAAVGVLSMVGALLSLGVGLHFVDHPGALGAASLALVIGPLWNGLSTGAASLRLARRQAPCGAPRHPWRSPLPELRQGWPLFASQFTSALYTASGPVVVGLLAGVAQAGAYAALERIVNPIISLGLLTHVAAYPRLAALYRSDRRSYLALMRVVLLAYAAFSVALVAGVAAAWDPVLRFVFGEGAQQHAALLAAGLLWVIFGIFGTALTGYLTVSGQGRAVLPLTLRVLALSLLIGIPGVWAFGAWAWMLSLCAAQALVIACGWRAWRDESRARILAVT